ncbi:MAG: hypothetical protein AAGK09_11745 [Planctomycetota bacterium]
MNLVVFSDDWGRHPSSCQHLVRHLMMRGAVGEVVWVNTIGTRRVRLSWADAKRVAGRLRQMAFSRRDLSPSEQASGPVPRVVSPVMWPGFRAGWQRRFNAKRMVHAVNRAISEMDRHRAMRRPWVGLTTLPITADAVQPLREEWRMERWVYYGVDDFSVWPGLDGDVMDAMERELVGRVDAVCAVSETLVDRVGEMLNQRGTESAEESSRDTACPGVSGSHASRLDAKSPRRQVELLTHGVDLVNWSSIKIDLNTLPKTPDFTASSVKQSEYVVFTFWGLLDERMEADWLEKLLKLPSALVMLLGPITASWRLKSDFLWCLGQVDHAELPKYSSAADVLIMPYRDMPVTRAMQPLKLLEYLATYKPVVVRRLPATAAWADCCDVVETADEFVRVCRERAEGGLPAEQRAARERRLPGESWSEKSRQLETILRGGGV